MADIQNFIGFAQGERLIKEYAGFRMYSPVKARINLSVTNKRLIVYSSVKNFFVQNQPSLFQQIAISEIRGLEFIRGTRYNYPLFAISVVVLFAGLVAAFAGSLLAFLSAAGSALPLVGVLLLVVGAAGIIAFVARPKKIFRFVVRGQAIDLSIGEIGTAAPAMTGGEDLQGLVEELGALVIQIQEGTL